MLCIKLNVKNDCNGNPQRVFVLFNSDGSINRAIDEGYLGDEALKGYETSDWITEFDTSVLVYKQLLARYGVKSNG